MALTNRSCCRFLVRVLVSIVIIIGISLIASLGGFLNRCRGGYVQYGQHMGYWAAHIISRHTFSLTTGLLVYSFFVGGTLGVYAICNLIAGCHLRAGMVVWLLTQWSLYIGWGTYMMIGEAPTNYKSREGIFDWMLGRQDVEWNFTHRFIREYSGMSLRGLIWTAPQGYALQQLGFGWQYGLSGSLMGAVYFAGGQSHIPQGELLSDYLNGAIPFSEFYWGSLIWFVLITLCLAQSVHRLRQWAFSNSSDAKYDPTECCQVFKYQSLNHKFTNFIYNVFYVLLWILLAASTTFYSLIIQTDMRNKGQTLFGLLTSLLVLTVFIIWTWSSAYTSWSINRDKKQKSEYHSPDRWARINNADYFEQRGVPGTFYEPSETDRLLPWPYSHPDKNSSRNPSPMSFNNTSPLMQRSPPSLHPMVPQKPLHPLVNVAIKLWISMEDWVYMDMFVLIRHLIGAVSLVSVVITMVLCCIGIVWDLHSPTFDPQYYVCVNESIWNDTVV